MSKSKQGIYGFLALIGLTLTIGCKSNAVKPDKVQPPNLLFIFPDQLRNAAIGINNQDPVYTPNIDKLAKEGMIISDAISNYPLCSPYRAMLMTGKLPYHNSVLSNANSNRYKYNNSWQDKDVSFSDVLVKNGYDAGYVGKLHLISPPPIADKDSVIWDAFTPIKDRHGFSFWCAYGADDTHNNPHYWINNAPASKTVYAHEWSPKYEADVIIDYLKHPSKKTRDKNKPFALFWSINPPHPPYQYIPEEYLSRYKDKSLKELLVRDNVDLDTDAKELAFHNGATRGVTDLAKHHVKDYFGAITGVDDQIGRVLKVLKEQGLDKNTIVVITSDHGEMMGSHGLMSKNIWFDEAMNVPFIIRWPDKIGSGQKKDLLLSSPDIMPTLLNMMGATKGMPQDLDGKDLSSIILEGKGEQPAAALYYYIKGGHPESGHRGIKTKRYTYVIAIDDENGIHKLMYDNAKDPYQMQNIAGKGLTIEKTLRNQLLQQLKEKEDPWLVRYQKLIE